MPARLTYCSRNAGVCWRWRAVCNARHCAWGSNFMVREPFFFCVQVLRDFPALAVGPTEGNLHHVMAQMIHPLLLGGAPLALPDR